MKPELGFGRRRSAGAHHRAALSTTNSIASGCAKYLTLMAFQVPAHSRRTGHGAWHNGLVSLAIIALSLPLPWMAVLIANDRPPRRAEEPRRYDDAHRRTDLPARHAPGTRIRPLPGSAQTLPTTRTESVGTAPLRQFPIQLF